MASTTPGYKPFARILHWTLAIMIIATLPIGQIMVLEGISRSLMDTLYILHKNGGVIILLLMLIRLIYRLMNPPPPLPDTLEPWQKMAAEATHVVLYFMIFFMTITGIVRLQSGGFPIEMLRTLGIPPIIPRNQTVETIAMTAHFWGRFVLVAALLAHIGAALQHKFIKKDAVFSRMWPMFPG